jgi:Ca2+-binding RTX toxin-like protein
LTITDTAGVDTLDFSGAGPGVAVNVGATAAQKIFGTATTLTLKGGIENLTGTASSDRLTGSAAANVIRALGGDDIVSGGDGNDTLYGGDGNDTLSGGNGKDLIFGESGNDILNGNAGNNVLVGGDGNDQLNAGPARNVLIGGIGEDNLKGAKGDDILVGGTTLYDDSPEELLAILAEWSSTARTTAKRVSDLTQGISGPKGRAITLTRESGLIDDSAADSLYGGPAGDWYLSFDLDVFVDNPGKTEIA